MPKNMTPVLLPDEKPARWSKDRRIRFIDFRLQWEGRLNRGDLTSFLGISVPQASADLATYMSLAPENMVYDHSSRTYVATDLFKAYFPTSNPQHYLWQLLALDRGLLEPAQASMGFRPPIESVQLPWRNIPASVLRGLIQAIAVQGTVEVDYQSIAREEQRRRDISPHALCTDGLRWHVRAYCHLREGFRDFVLGRILSIERARPSTVSQHDDSDWHRSVKIVLTPSPHLSKEQRRGVEADYAMRGGTASFSCRQAMLFYTLRALNFELDGTPRAGERQLVIQNLEAIRPLLPRPGQA